LADPVVPIVPLAVDPTFYNLSYYDVSTAFVPSAGGFGGPGSSGGSGDELLRIVDAGNFRPAGDTAPTPGDVCANIYVFNDIQEQQECCSCPITANELLTVSVMNQLTSNPFNPHESLEAGVIKIVGSAGACSNSPTATTAAGPYVIAGGLTAWINHTETMASNQFTFKPPFGFITSTSVDEFTNAALDSGELARLQAGCTAINNANKFGSQTIGICQCAPPPPPPIVVSVAYANNFNSNVPGSCPPLGPACIKDDFFPTSAPGWKGSPGVTPGVNFFGFAGTGDFDSGGILIENTSATDSVVVNGVTVDFNQPSPFLHCTVGTGTTVSATNCASINSTAVNPTDPWVGVFPYTIAPGGFLILAQTNPGLTDPTSQPLSACHNAATENGQCSNFDTTDLPPLGIGQFGNPSGPSCTPGGGVIPKLHVNVTVASNPAVTVDFTDKNQVLNLSGVDGALCKAVPAFGNHQPGFEGHDWEQIFH
jgi:hypothetical protein